MKGKDLLEGMSFVDEKFIDEAEAKPAKRYYLLRWGALAACLTLILLAAPRLSGQQSENQDIRDYAGASAQWEENKTGESATEDHIYGSQSQTPAVVGEDGRMPLYGQQYIRTNGYHEDAAYPVITVIRSRAELEAYCKENRGLYDLESGFLAACGRYDDAYFAEKDLLLVLLEEGSGSVRHELSGIRPHEDGWYLTGRRIVPEVGTCDMAQWHILAELEKDLIHPTDTVTLGLVNE